MLQPPPVIQNTYLLGTSQEHLLCKLFPKKLLALISKYLPAHSGDTSSLIELHCLLPLSSCSFSASMHLSQQQAPEATEGSSQKLLTHILPYPFSALWVYTKLNET